MREVTVISGKGGTGKTSVTAALAVLARRCVIADCDVDAADLHLLLAPRRSVRHEVTGGHLAAIRPEACTGCGECASLCRFDAVRVSADAAGAACYAVDPLTCEGCSVCVRFCPESAIDFAETVCGAWMASETRCGPMVHARLAVAAENSGKLVTIVRREARRVAEERGERLVLVDGPPGIGCPVIAAVTGADLVLIVTEPTVSGAHDLDRVLSLTGHFCIPAAVCVNKWDLDPEMAAQIEARAGAAGARVAGRIRYDRGVTAAQMAGLTVVETAAAAADDLRHLWHQLCE